MRPFAAAFLFAILAPLVERTALAQWNPEVPGDLVSIESAVLGETRAVSVILPPHYETSADTRFDVLYVLDAEDDARRIGEIVRALQDRQGFVPPLIIVSIWTMLKWDRDHDLTPTHVADVHTSGGAARFLAFLRDELVPHIDRRYRTADRILYGHSYGGLFGMYALLNEPGLFPSVVLTDPSFWYDDRQLVRSAADKFRDGTFTATTLWIGSRDGRDHERMGVAAMESELRAHAPGGLRWRSESYADETHFSVLHKSAYDGLKYAYSGFAGNRPLWFMPTAGVVAKGLPFPFIVDSRLPRDPPMRFSTDGSVPSMTSPPLESFNEMRADSATARVTLRSSGFRPRHDRSFTVDYTPGEIWPARKNPRKSRPGGLCYAYYEGEWQQLPEFARLRPLRSGFTSRLDVSAFPRQKDFGVVLQGMVAIEREGHYLFVLDSDDGSRLWIDGQRIIDHDGLHGLGATRDFLVPLASGMHSIRIDYFQKGGGAQLLLKLISPGETEPADIPAARQFCAR